MHTCSDACTAAFVAAANRDAAKRPQQMHIDTQLDSRLGAKYRTNMLRVQQNGLQQLATLLTRRPTPIACPYHQADPGRLRCAVSCLAGTAWQGNGRHHSHRSGQGAGPDPITTHTRSSVAWCRSRRCCAVPHRYRPSSAGTSGEASDHSIPGRRSHQPRGEHHAVRGRERSL